MDESVIAMKDKGKSAAAGQTVTEEPAVAELAAAATAQDTAAVEPAVEDDAAVATDSVVPEPSPAPVPEPEPVPEPGPVPLPPPGPDPVPEPTIEPPIELSGPPSQRLAQLGIELPPVVTPVAAYVPAVRTGNLVFTSGQLPMVDGQLSLTGVVGDQPVDLSIEQAKALARIAALNAISAVASLVDIDQVVRVVKVVGFVASAPGFTGQPQVINGASELLGQVWGAVGGHARSAVGVIALPLNSPVEVELVVEVGATEIEAAVPVETTAAVPADASE